MSVKWAEWTVANKLMLKPFLTIIITFSQYATTQYTEFLQKHAHMLAQDQDMVVKLVIGS